MQNISLAEFKNKSKPNYLHTRKKFLERRREGLTHKQYKEFCDLIKSSNKRAMLICKIGHDYKRQFKHLYLVDDKYYFIYSPKMGLILTYISNKMAFRMIERHRKNQVQFKAS